ncbi:MAG TPA: hypothetical protein PKY95_07275 [candidate division Zixibacteria bacterium]|nr:hypothetical protein [candidate division Zixibacteria bacterium]
MKRGHIAQADDRLPRPEGVGFGEVGKDAGGSAPAPHAEDRVDGGIRQQFEQVAGALRRVGGVKAAARADRTAGLKLKTL